MAEYKIHNRMTHWQKTYPAWISFAAIAFLLAVWEIICSTGLISSLFLPAPSAILTALGKLITSGEISRSLTASLYRILLGFALGSIIGLLVGLVTGTSALMDRIGTPIVNALYPIPKSLYCRFLFSGLESVNYLKSLSLLWAFSFPLR